jgi:hypothetical protein
LVPAELFADLPSRNPPVGAGSNGNAEDRGWWFQRPRGATESIEPPGFHAAIVAPVRFSRKIPPGLVLACLVGVLFLLRDLAVPATIAVVAPTTTAIGCASSGTIA